jgi:DNA-binding FrmR family transcriptional regulator
MASKSAGAARRSEPAPPGGPPAATPSGKDDYLRRLGKIEGQVRGLQKMIEADTWCPDVVTQVASATRALQEVAVGLVSDHLRHCVIRRAFLAAEAARLSSRPQARSGKSSGS